MITLPERAGELQERLEQLEQAKSGARNMGALTTRSTQVAEDALLLQRVVATVTVLRAIGAPPEIDLQFRWRLHQKMEELREQQSRSPAYIFQRPGEEVFRDQRRYLRDFIGKVNSACAEAWAQYVARETPGIEPSLLTALGKIEAFSALTAQIRAQQARLDRLGGSVPSGMEEAERFQETCQTVRRLWEQLVGADLPPDVLAFLMALGQGKAPLSLLTDNVRAWVAEKGLGESLYVVAG